MATSRRRAGLFDRSYERMSKFSEFFIAHGPSFTVPSNHAVYTLHLTSAVGSFEFVPAFGCPDGDRHCVLYIGATESPPHRLWRMIASLRPTTKCCMHPAGGRLKELLPSYELSLFARLVVRLFQQPNPKKIERELLEAYLRQHGRLPVLNDTGRSNKKSGRAARS